MARSEATEDFPALGGSVTPTPSAATSVWGSGNLAKVSKPPSAAPAPNRSRKPQQQPKLPINNGRSDGSGDKGSDRGATAAPVVKRSKSFVEELVMSTVYPIKAQAQAVVAAQAKVQELLDEKRTNEGDQADNRDAFKNAVAHHKAALEKFRAVQSKEKRSKEAVAKELTELEGQQATATLSLHEEKSIIQKIGTLRAYVAAANELEAADERVTNLKQNRAELGDSLEQWKTKISTARDNVVCQEIALRHVLRAHDAYVKKHGAAAETTSADAEKKKKKKVKLPKIDPEEVHREEVSAPEKRVRQLMGQGGASQRRIERDFGVLLQVEYGKRGGGGNSGRESNKQPIVRVAGVEKDVGAAVEVVREWLQEALPSEEIQVKPQLINTLIGKDGHMARKLVADSGALMDVDKSKNVVKLGGARYNIDIISSAIKDLLQNLTVETMSIPTWVVQSVLSDAAEWNEQYGVRVEVSRKDLQVTLSGPSKGVGECVGKIKELQVATTRVDETFQLTPTFVSLLLTGSPNIASIEADSGAVLSVDKETSVVTMRGVPSQIAIARAKLEAIKGEMKTKTVKVPEKAIPAVLGRKGSTLRALQDKHEVTMFLNRDAREITIVGEPGKMDGASKSIQEVVDDNLILEEVMEVDVELLRSVFAKNSDQLQQLQGASSASASQSWTQDAEASQSLATVRVDYDRGIVLKGIQKAIDASKKMVNDMIAGKVHQTREFPEELLGSVIGKGGSNVRALQDKHGVIISISRPNVALPTAGEEHAKKDDQSESEEQKQQQTNESGSKPAERLCTMVVVGVADAVETTIVEVEEILEEHKMVEVARQVDPSVVGTIIGKGGKGIKQLQAGSSARVKIAKSGSLKIKGTKNDVAIVTERLEKLLDDNQLEIVEIPPDMVSSVIGRGGETIRSLQERSRTHMEVDNDKSLVRIRGSQANCMWAKAALDTIIAKGPVSSFVVPIGGELFDDVIGWESSNMRVLKNVCKYHIDRRALSVKLTGTQAEIEDGRAELSKLMRLASLKDSDTRGGRNDRYNDRGDWGNEDYGGYNRPNHYAHYDDGQRRDGYDSYQQYDDRYQQHTLSPPNGGAAEDPVTPPQPARSCDEGEAVDESTPPRPIASIWALSPPRTPFCWGDAVDQP